MKFIHFFLFLHCVAVCAVNTAQVTNLFKTVLGMEKKNAASLSSRYGPVVMEEAKQFANRASQGAGKAGEWAAKNPAQAGAALLVGAGVTAVAAPALVSGSLLSAAGFGASGVKASSLAAVAHGGIGNVAAGSTFATLQSAGALGAGAAVVNGAVQVVGGTVAAAGSAILAKL